MSDSVFDCPRCGIQQPAELANGFKMFNCSGCGQAIHPPSCGCWECLLKPKHQKPQGHPADCGCFDCEMALLEAQMGAGLTSLRGVKKIRLEDEKIRLEEGLPPALKYGGDIGVVITGKFVHKCHHCGRFPLSNPFCPDCGHRVDGQPCPRC